MTIKWRPKMHERLDAYEIGRVTEAAKIFNMSDCVAIDSYEISADGPTLASIFLLNDEFIAEVKVNSKDFSCDIAQVKSASNLRIKKTTVPLQGSDDTKPNATACEEQQPEAKPVRIEFAELTIVHHGNLITKFGFFGSEIDEWIEFLMQIHSTRKIWP